MSELEYIGSPKLGIVAKLHDDPMAMILAPIGSVFLKDTLDRAGIVNFAVEGGEFDPDEYPELNEILTNNGYEAGRLPDMRGQVVQKNEESDDGSD